MDPTFIVGSYREGLEEGERVASRGQRLHSGCKLEPLECEFRVEIVFELRVKSLVSGIWGEEFEIEGR